MRFQEKFEARNPKYETNPNNQNPNDQNICLKHWNLEN